MHFPQWVDLKGQDAVPETVHQIVCMVDPIADKSWIRIRAKKGSAIQTDGIHSGDKIHPGSDERETLSEGVKILKGEYVAKVSSLVIMDSDGSQNFRQFVILKWISVSFFVEPNLIVTTLKHLFKLKTRIGLVPVFTGIVHPLNGPKI